MTNETLNKILARLDDIEKQKCSSMWDLAIKALIPIVMGIGAWSVGLEIRTSRLEALMENNPPQWLKNDVGEIKSAIKDLALRIRHLEAAVK